MYREDKLGDFSYNVPMKIKPMFDGRRPVDPIKRYFHYVVKKEGCWSWNATTGNHGYGLLRSRNRNIAVHRLSWEIHKGPIPKGMCVLHKCDNRICSNPEHLWLGTRLENIADATAKGRVSKGEAHYASKLTERSVKNIRERIENGEKGKVLAREFRVNSSCISKIKHRTHWKHL